MNGATAPAKAMTAKSRPRDISGRSSTRWLVKATLRLAVAQAGRPTFGRPAKFWIAQEPSDALSLLRAVLDAVGCMVVIHHFDFV